MRPPPTFISFLCACQLEHTGHGSNLVLGCSTRRILIPSSAVTGSTLEGEPSSQHGRENGRPVKGHVSRFSLYDTRRLTFSRAHAQIVPTNSRRFSAGCWRCTFVSISRAVPPGSAAAAQPPRVAADTRRSLAGAAGRQAAPRAVLSGQPLTARS